MIPDNSMQVFKSLEHHFNYLEEKEAFLNTLSDEDLLFFKSVLNDQTLLANPKNISKVKQIDVTITNFEHPSRIAKAINYVSSWIWSKPPKTLQENEKNEIIKKICDSFGSPHLDLGPLTAHLSAEPEIGTYEKLFKKPNDDDVNVLKNWQTGQDNYWRQIADKIGCPIPDPLPPQFIVAEYVKKYLQNYKNNILELTKLKRENLNVIDLNKIWQTVDPGIPPEITTILSQRPTIESFLKLKEWKTARDAVKIQEQLEKYHGMVIDGRPRMSDNTYTNYKEVLVLGEKFSENIDFFIQKGYLTYMYNNLGVASSLNLNHCHLTNLPEALTKLDFFTDIHLNSNQLETLPDSFGNLKNLEIIDLAGNRLTSLPKSMELMQSLEVLRINHNNFQEIPDFIVNLKSLKSFEVTGNPLKIIPDHIGEFEKSDDKEGIWFMRKKPE